MVYNLKISRYNFFYKDFIEMLLLYWVTKKIVIDMENGLYYI